VQKAGSGDKLESCNHPLSPDDPVEEEQGPGLGIIAEFGLDGRHLRTLHASRRLNEPWGLAMAPEGFGPFSKRLIVGNFGDGTLVAFGLKRGRRGYLRSRDQQAIQIDGLWGLAFGEGAPASGVRITCTSPPGRTARPMACSAACTSWRSEGRGVSRWPSPAGTTFFAGTRMPARFVPGRGGSRSCHGPYSRTVSFEEKARLYTEAVLPT
jgi:hypothetical protein